MNDYARLPIRSAFHLRWCCAALALGVCLTPSADRPPDIALLKTLYAKEVLSYCGLRSDSGVSGYQWALEQLLAGRDWQDPAIQTVRDRAWQAAHEEWQNRGLGGYRRWCRIDGAHYLGVFERWHEQRGEHNQGGDIQIDTSTLPTPR